MARNTKKTTKTTAEIKPVVEQEAVETTKPAKVVKTSTKRNAKPAALTPASKASAEIISKAVKATEQKATQIHKPIIQEEPVAATVASRPVAKPQIVEEDKPASMYDLLLGRYCKLVSEYRAGTTKKRPIAAFITLIEHVVRTGDYKVFNEMLKFFTLEMNGLMSNHNALAGIETINDLTMKNRAMVLFTIFNGLANQKATGRRPLFSIGTVRDMVKNERFTNWVNLTMFG